MINKKILIIGGAGFLGSHLSEELLELGYQVVVVDRIRGENQKAGFFNVDADDENKLREVFKEQKPDVVYHLAGAINLRQNIADPLFQKSLDFLGRTGKILDCCKENKVRKFVFFSSGGAVYGNAKIIPTPEDYPCHPSSLYGLANLIIEKYISLYCEKHGLSFIILRLGNVYGPGQWKEGIIPQLINNKEPIIIGDGSQTRDFIYVDDLVRAAVIAMDKNGTYNIATGKGSSINEIIATIEKVTGSKINPKYRVPENQGIEKNILDITRARKEFPWESKISLEQGLIKIIK